MTTADMIKTSFEVLAVIAVFVGIFYEDKLVAFEEKIAEKIHSRKGR